MRLTAPSLPSRRVTSLLVIVAACTMLGTSAADAAPVRTQSYSGMDLRDYAGPIPTSRGTLIQQGPLDPVLYQPQTARAYRYLYSTPNVFGEMATSTAAIYLPQGSPPPGGWPVLAWAHGTSGLGDNCAPSTLIVNKGSDYLGHWLARGYAIVATDYAGLGTPGLMSYLNVATAATSVVDSVIAAHEIGPQLSNKWAVVGQSQGAGAALATARYATELGKAAGLDYRGAVATGVPAYVEQILSLGGPDLPGIALPANLNAYLIYILTAFIDARPDIATADVLTPAGRAVVKRAQDACLYDFRPELGRLQLRSLFRAPLSSVPGFDRAIREYLQIPSQGYDRPVFFGQGLLDTDTPSPAALAFYQQMRESNEPVELHVYPDKDHASTMTASLTDSTPFVSRIMK